MGNILHPSSCLALGGEMGLVRSVVDAVVKVVLGADEVEVEERLG
jgi:hypothetical protein